MSDLSPLLFAELNRVASEVAGGELSARARLDGLDQETASVAAAINRMLDALSAPLNAATAALHSLAHGRIPDFVTDDFQGDFNRVKQDTNLCVAVVLGVVREIEELVASAKCGRLAARGNDWDFDGCWKDLLSRLNDLVDAFIQPFHVSSRYMEMISRGVIPERIAERYPGELNRIRRNMNTLIGTLDGLLAEVNQLCGAAMEGRLDQRAEAGRFENEFGRIVAGINGTLDAVVAPLKASANTLNRVAQGDLTMRLEGDFSGDFARLQSDINSMAERLHQSMAQISGTAQELGAAAEQLTGISSELSQNADHTTARASMASGTSRQIAGSVGALSTGARETARAIKEIAANIGQVCHRFQSADAEARRALQAVSQLTEASGNIGEVIKLIGGIAGETNALSVTAQRQAETAVGASRGFGVVAEEVKRLAGQIAQSAEGLDNKMAGMRNAISGAAHGSGTEGEAGQLDQRLMQVSREVVRGIGEISQVAWQTKLLSLNAAVEAARAGNSADQFTLVARETGRLAEQTGQAAGGIGHRLDAIGARSREGAATIEAITGIVGDLRQSADSIATEAQEKAEATARMGELASSSVEAASQIVDHVTAVADAASATTTAARQTDQQALQLARTAARLQQLVDGFRI